MKTVVKERSNSKQLWKKIFYGFIVVFVVEAIFLIKGYAFNAGNSVLFLYTLVVSVFMLSRVLGSFFYKNYLKRLTPAQKEALKTYEPTVTIVIPCYNEQDCIYKTIHSCVSCDYPNEKLEVIAVNDCSTDNTLAEMKRAQKDHPHADIKIANFKKNQGKRGGMVYGFEHAKGEIVVQIDSDSFPKKDSLIPLIAPFIDRKVGAVVGHTDPENKDESWLTKMQTAYYFMSFRALKATESIFDMVFCCSGCFCAYRKSYILPILDKFLSEKFLGKTVTFGDDRALTNWMIRQGKKTVYVDEATATTIVPNTIKQFLKQQVRWKKGWFINSTRILPEIYKRDKFVLFTYLIPLLIATILAPFIAIKAIFLNLLVFGLSPIYYVLGIFLVSLLLIAHYKMYTNDKYARYMLVYSLFNMMVLSYVMFYALYDLKNMKWGTR